MTHAAATDVPPFERLAALIDGLCRAVATHGARGLLTAALQLLLWSRLNRMARRARVLARRMAAGKPLITPRPARATPRSAPRPPPSRPYVRLPRGLLWLVRVTPGTAVEAARLRFLLDDPEMARLAGSPPMRRLIRPLCRMLGVDPPPPIKPQAPPGPMAAEPPPPPPELTHAEPRMVRSSVPPLPVIPQNAA